MASPYKKQLMERMAKKNAKDAVVVASLPRVVTATELLCCCNPVYVSLKFIDTGWMLWYTHSLLHHSGLHHFGSKRRKRILLAVSESTVGMLGFWKYHEKSIPILSKLAQVHFTISSSSVPVECMFSTTGLIFNGERSSVAPEKLNRVLSIHDNFSLITNDSC